MVAASFIVGKTGLPEELIAFPSFFTRSLCTRRSNIKKRFSSHAKGPAKFPFVYAVDPKHAMQAPIVPVWLCTS